MIVKEKEWLSRPEQEAVLVVGNDDHECMVFSHPCVLEVGDVLQEPLLALFVDNIFRIEETTHLCICRQNKGFSHLIIAKVASVGARTVTIECIEIELDCAFPGDVVPGDVVQFSCERIDATS